MSYSSKIFNILINKYHYSAGITKIHHQTTLRFLLNKLCQKYFKTLSSKFFNFLNSVKYAQHKKSKEDNKFFNHIREKYLGILQNNQEWSFFNYSKIMNTELCTTNCQKNVHFDASLLNIDVSNIIQSTLLKNAVFIKFRKNYTCKKTLSLFNYLSSPNVLSSTHITVHVGRNSFLNLYMSDISKKSAVNSVIVNIVLEKNSTLEFTSLQNEHQDTFNIRDMKVTQKHGSKFIFNNVCTSGNFFFNNVNIYQDEESGIFNTNWINIAHSNQRIYDLVDVNHNASNCSSSEYFKGLYYNNCKRVLENIVKIEKGIKNIVSHQESRNLILSLDSYIKVLPAMEVNSNNVQCTHGVVIDRVNKGTIFYMCSRGIHRKTAENIIVISFLKNLLKNITCKSIKDDIWFYIRFQLQRIIL